jgi:peroxiredoxin
MKKFFLFVFILTIAGFGASAWAHNSTDGGDKSAPAPGSVGSTVADFKLKDANGKWHELSEVKGSKGTVIVFVSTVCPMVRAYNDRIIALASDFQAQGINVVGIYANAGESSDEIKNHYSAVHYNFTVLVDHDRKVADLLGAERTPETFLLDANNQIVYRGRIDNSASLPMVKTSELRDAINDVMAGRAVAKPETTAVGCSIKRAA